MRRWQSIRVCLENKLPGIWASKGLVAMLLWPASQLYRLLSALDRQRQHKMAHTQPALGLPVWGAIGMPVAAGACWVVCMVPRCVLLLGA